MWAAVRGQVDAVKTLTERGAEVNMLTEVIIYIVHCVVVATCMCVHWAT